jgi:hypothetical protein
MTFSPSEALTLAAEAEASLDANARGDWPTPAPDARALASMLRAAVARVEELEAERNRSARDLAVQVWFVARGSNGAGQFVGDSMLGVKCREDFDLFWRDPHAYYAREGTDWTTQVRQGDEINALHTQLARLQNHYDRAAPEHNLLALLDLYEHRASQAEAALGEMTKERDWAVAVQRAALESQERLGTTLAAALQAKDEACDIAERLGAVTTTSTGAVYQYEQCRRIAALRSIGRAEPCDTAELPVVKITQVAELLSEACNRWEWFAQRFGAVDTREHYDYPRLAEMRGAITRITELRSVGKEKP